MLLPDQWRKSSPHSIVHLGRLMVQQDVTERRNDRLKKPKVAPESWLTNVRGPKCFPNIFKIRQDLLVLGMAGIEHTLLFSMEAVAFHAPLPRGLENQVAGELVHGGTHGVINGLEEGQLVPGEAVRLTGRRSLTGRWSLASK